MILKEKKRSWTNKEEEELESMETVNREAMLSVSKAVQTQESVLRELPSSIRNVAQNALAQQTNISGHVFVDDGSQIEQSERVQKYGSFAG